MPRSWHAYEFHLKQHLDGLCATLLLSAESADPIRLQMNYQIMLAFSPVREQT